VIQWLNSELKGEKKQTDENREREEKNKDQKKEVWRRGTTRKTD